MCLAMPGKVISIEDDKMYGTADFEGIKKRIIVALVPKVNIGDYVVVHAGSAISILDEEEAHKTLAIWYELAAKEGKDIREYA